MDDRQVRRRGGASGRIWAGLFLLLVGGVLLLDQMGFPLPDWLFSWHILLIVLGLFIGLRHNFRGGAWIIMILVGSVFFIQDYYPKTEIHRFLWPGVLIFVGLMIIFRPKRAWQRDEEDWHKGWGKDWNRDWERKWRRYKHGHRWDWHPRFGPNPYQNQSTNPDLNNPGGDPANQNTGAADPNAGAANQNYDPSRPGYGTGNAGYGPANPNTGRTGAGTGGYAYSSEDYIDTTSVFGGVHKKVVSKNFKGGDITTFLGGTEIDLSQADFVGMARLDVTQVMGGTKIIVPAHWEVRSQVTAIFAGFEDKRQQPAIVNPEKVLIIEGTSIFGGIELKNF